MTLPIKYILYAILIILVQVLVGKHIVFIFDAIPQVEVIIYPLLLIILPVNTPGAVVVLISFFSGLSLDFFYNSPGVHTSAFVLTGFLRKTLLNALEPRIGYSVGDTPLLVSRTDYWYFIFAGILLVIHIFFYYIVSYFSLAYFVDISIKTLLTFLVSMLLISLHGIIWRALN